MKEQTGETFSEGPGYLVNGLQRLRNRCSAVSLAGISEQPGTTACCETVDFYYTDGFLCRNVYWAGAHIEKEGKRAFKGDRANRAKQAGALFCGKTSSPKISRNTSAVCSIIEVYGIT